MEANMFKTTHNLQTGETTQEPLTQSEIDVLLANRIEQEKINVEIEKKAKSDKLAKDALLAKLGITAEEAKLLLS